ncbi:MAG: hypothetical protein EBZ69_06195 [Alphaproteobacteria bacterium]|nr:hypothetical protein [Alphaproteobacteria bacterium]
MSGISERYWLEHYKEALIDNILRQRKLDISTRLLIEEGDNLVLIGQASYRAIPPYLFNQMPSYIYADRYATIMWGPPLRILVIQNTLLVQNFRKQFEYNYSIGKRISDDQVIIPRLEGLPYLPGN